MKPKNKRAARLSKRFKDAKKLDGEIIGRKIREERRMWKRTMSKHSRNLDKCATKESFELIDI